MLLDQDDGQPVGQLQTLSGGQAKFPEALRRGRLGAPWFLRHGAGDGFTFGLGIGLFLRTGRIVDHPIAGQTINDCASRGLELVGCDALHAFYGSEVIALEILGQVAGIVHKLVVLVKAVGQTSKAAQPFEPADHLRLNQIAGAVEFRLGGSLGAHFLEFLVNCLFQILAASRRAWR